MIFNGFNDEARDYMAIYLWARWMQEKLVKAGYGHKPAIRWVRKHLLEVLKEPGLNSYRTMEPYCEEMLCEYEHEGKHHA